MNDNSDIMDINNIVQTGPLKGKRIQYYLLSNKTGMKGMEGDFWKWLKKL